MSLTPGIDVSRWQGEIDWLQVAQQGFRFAVIRATVGDYYTDPRFYENWRGATEAGLMLSAYHVVRPKLPAETQITRFLDVLDARKSDLPLVLDIEIADGQTSAMVTQIVADCAALIETRTGRKPILYTGKWFWDPTVLRRQEWRDYDLWIANYGVRSPTLPVDWPAWMFWQHSEMGSVAGVASNVTDLDWFNGSYEELLAYCEVHPYEIEQRLAARGASPMTLRVITPYARVHNGPGLEFAHIGDLSTDDVIEVRGLGGEDVWVSIGPGQWVALKTQGTTYLSPDQA